MYALHFLFGVSTSLVNNFSSYMFKKNIIPEFEYNDDDKKIIGTWKISGDKNYTELPHPTLSTLNKIPYECKCTNNQIDRYAYTLGQLCCTYFYWVKMSENDYNNIVFLPTNLFDEW